MSDKVSFQLVGLPLPVSNGGHIQRCIIVREALNLRNLPSLTSHLDVC